MSGSCPDLLFRTVKTRLSTRDPSPDRGPATSSEFTPVPLLTTTTYKETVVTMAEAETLTVGSLSSLFTLNGAYLVGYGWLFGMCKCDDAFSYSVALK